MRLGPFHFHLVKNDPIRIKFHVVNFGSDTALKSAENTFNELLDEGWRVNNHFEQDGAVVYELWIDKKHIVKESKNEM